MKFRLYYLYYILVIILLLIGFFKKDTKEIYDDLNSSIIPGYWGYIIPATIYSFIIGFLFHLFHFLHRPIKGRLIIVHWLLIILGIFFSFNIYRVITIMINSGAPDTSSIATGWLVLLSGPALFLISIGVLIAGFVTAKKI